MPLPSFQLAAGQNAFTVAERISDYEIAFPLGSREPTALLVSADYMQLANSYTRAAVDSNISVASPQNVSNTVTAYFIDDTGFEDLGAGLKKYTRQWATIPASWIGPEEEYAFQFPAYAISVAFGNTYPVSNVDTSGSNYAVYTNANGIVASDDVYFDINYVRAVQNYHVTFVAPVLSSTDGVKVILPGILPGSGTNFSGVTGTLRKGNRGRGAPETLIVGSRVQYDYALADDTTIDTALPLMEKFTPVTSGTALETTTLTASGTIPTSGTYQSMINAGTYIVAEPSTRRRYLGNIFERATRMVPAR